MQQRHWFSYVHSIYSVTIYLKAKLTLDERDLFKNEIHDHIFKCVFIREDMKGHSIYHLKIEHPVICLYNKYFKYGIKFQLHFTNKCIMVYDFKLIHFIPGHTYLINKPV